MMSFLKFYYVTVLISLWDILIGINTVNVLAMEYFKDIFLQKYLLLTDESASLNSWKRYSVSWIIGYFASFWKEEEMKGRLIWFNGTK